MGGSNKNLRQRGALKFFSSPLFDGVDEVAHGFLTRAGGVSRPPFDTLNFDGSRGDNPANVLRNRAILREGFSIPAEGVFTMRQVHGSAVFVAEGGGKDIAERPEADALITLQAGLPIGILTADCVPVLLYDPVKRAAGAVHAGRRGVTCGVISRAILEMRSRFGSDPGDMAAAIGPHIGPCCYRVGKEVYDEFNAKDHSFRRFFLMKEDGLYLDIGHAAARVLSSAGVPDSRIDFAAPCTACNTELFFSYRREGVTGRQLSFIMIR